MTEPTDRPADEVAFGEALRELESIIGSLESGSLELEDSLDRYERGVSLLRSLQSRLAEAQQRVTVLLGELEEEPDSETAGGDAGEEA
jgi:exodeoxyribonuclease VII small subunit